jgi:hypothetical protein
MGALLGNYMETNVADDCSGWSWAGLDGHPQWERGRNFPHHLARKLRIINPEDDRHFSDGFVRSCPWYKYETYENKGSIYFPAFYEIYRNEEIEKIPYFDQKFHPDFERFFSLRVMPDVGYAIDEQTIVQLSSRFDWPIISQDLRCGFLVAMVEDFRSRRSGYERRGVDFDAIRARFEVRIIDGFWRQHQARIPLRGEALTSDSVDRIQAWLSRLGPAGFRVG